MTLTAIPGVSCSCTPVTRYACGHCWHDSCWECGQCGATGTNECICHCRLGFTPTEQETGPIFYLGTHRGQWLSKLGVPLCLSVENLDYKGPLPRAVWPWMLDSGGFNQIGKHGEYTFTPLQYAAMVARCRDEAGMLKHAAIMDWMTEDRALARSGLSVDEHVQRTVHSYLDLMAIDDTLPFFPIVQGREVSDYERCVALYERHGIDLTKLPLVGVGSVCKKQNTPEAAAIITTLADHGIALHAFGLKRGGLDRCAESLASADSCAWPKKAQQEALEGRRLLPDCEGRHKSCSNCLIYAMTWREDIINNLSKPRQIPFDLTA